MEGSFVVDDSRLYSIGGMNSSSPAMFARRRRILAEARRLIARGQRDGFSVRELCDKADVAPNTLYNAFGSKENVVALAILQYFEDFHASIAFSEDADSFAGVIEREMTTAIRNLSIPHYVHAVAGLYFSNSGNAPLRQVLIGIAGHSYFPWLQRLQVHRQLERGVDIQRVVSNLSAMLWAQVHEWRVGALTDDTSVTARFDAVLSYLAGVTRAEARKDVRSLLADLRGPQKLISASEAHARQLLETGRVGASPR